MIFTRSISTRRMPNGGAGARRDRTERKTSMPLRPPNCECSTRSSGLPRSMHDRSQSHLSLRRLDGRLRHAWHRHAARRNLRRDPRDVPAGTNYASYRMGGFAPSPSVDATQPERDAWMQRAAGVGLPDPPVIVDFSSQQDNWAMTQPALVQAAQAGRLPLVLGWGPFGHTTFSTEIESIRSARRAGVSVAGDPQERSVSGLHACLVRSAVSVAECARGVRQLWPDERALPLEK